LNWLTEEGEYLGWEAAGSMLIFVGGEAKESRKLGRIAMDQWSKSENGENGDGETVEGEGENDGSVEE
jgi:hypothetical protein